MNLKYSILVVEDDLELTALLHFALSRHGYSVHTAVNGEEGLALWRQYDPDLVLIDVNLPRLSGFELARRARTEFSTPFVILSARTTEQDILDGFDLGADDYVTKPFSMQQLLARIRAVLRRHDMYRGPIDDPLIANSPLTFDTRRQLVRLGNREVRLTPIESRILRLLMEQHNAVVETHTIIEEIWGYTTDNISSLLKTHIHNLRRKLEANPGAPDLIRTVPGVGYTLDVEAAQRAADAEPQAV
ncbi:MAG TPA: response regulator transcription factor [Chloroflexota bacterium]|nr:response regulator transcription factor [Chloroflexota bacterium]